jgi:hypothetical protein
VAPPFRAHGPRLQEPGVKKLDSIDDEYSPSVFKYSQLRLETQVLPLALRSRLDPPICSPGAPAFPRCSLARRAM